MHVSRSIATGLVLIGAAACAGNPKPKTFGTAPALTPTVEVLGNDRLPLHLRVEMPESAHVAAFSVAVNVPVQVMPPSTELSADSVPPVTVTSPLSKLVTASEKVRTSWERPVSRRRWPMRTA